MVLVLTLPRDFAHRDLLVSMTFGVVMISILVNGITVAPLLRWFGIVKQREHREAYELARGKVHASNAALEELDRISDVRFSGDGRARLTVPTDRLPSSVCRELRSTVEHSGNTLCGLPRRDR